LAAPEILRTIEDTAFSGWLRETESFFGFYFFLLLHTFGLSLLVGSCAVVDLRILGAAPNLPLKPLKGLFAIMWVGFVVNATTGLLLLYAYPTKALTNVVFYAKLSLIALAVVTMQRIKKEVFDKADLTEAAMIVRGKKLAIVSLVLWIGAITAGRLLAYTYTYITYGQRG
jgi:hypothetical protein